MHRWVYDMDVTLSWDTIFGVLDAARKYMVEAFEKRNIKRREEEMQEKLIKAREIDIAALQTITII